MKLPTKTGTALSQDKLTPQTRTTAYHEKAAPWSRRNYLMGSKLFPQVTTAETTSPDPLAKQELR
jgi:hypothetical protein